MCCYQDIDKTGQLMCLESRVKAEQQTVFLPIIGLVPHEELRPSDLIGVNKDSYLILDKLPEGELIMTIQSLW
jgi:26S proteasome regulatory subunit T5